MNREIKFRAWHKTKEKYYPIVSLNFYTKEVCIGKPYVNVWASFDDVVLERYTGLKDKEDKEIYIGDLFKIKYDYNWKKEDYFEVVFSRKLGIILRNSEGRWFHLVDKIKDYEIVGNIHENEELLK